MIDAAMRSSRLALSPRAPHHAPVLYDLMNDWDVVRMLAVVPWPLRLEDVARAMDAGESGIEGFTVVGENGPIGTASIKPPGSGEPPRTMPRLGYWIGRRYWSRGYGMKLVAALTERAFRHYLGERVGAGVFADNAASHRVLEKLGFREVGRYPTHCLARAEEVETIDRQITRDAWNARSARP